MQRRIYGHATDVEIRPLNEEKAVQAAVDLIGEMFVFSVINKLLTHFTCTYYFEMKELRRISHKLIRYDHVGYLRHDVKEEDR